MNSLIGILNTSFIDLLEGLAAKTSKLIPLPSRQSLAKKHIVIYVPGLGDTNISNRKKMLSTWHYKNTEIVAHTVNWQIDEPWSIKLERLLATIDSYVAKDLYVSLIGESAGASAVMQALQHRTQTLNAVILLCGKSQYPNRISPSLQRKNPALYQAVTGSHAYIQTMPKEAKAKILNIHPFADPVVPVPETMIPGVQNGRIPSFGHAPSIAFGMTIWSFKIVRFIKTQDRKSS